MSRPDSFQPAPSPPRRQGSVSSQARPVRRKEDGDYLDRLNPEQREAVLHTEGPLLVLAGAGTGKTRVLTTRLAHILENGLAWPGQTLSVTFTNKAAREMRERVGNVLGERGEGLPWLGTFHAIGAKILRIHAECVGLESNFTILDTDDQIRLLKQVIQAANIDDKRWTAPHLAALINGWKNRGLIPDTISRPDAYQFANGQGGALYKTYQERLKTLNAADFGDLLLHNITIFRNNPDVLTHYHQRFRYILVDEYQDTNVCQYLWLRLLAQGSNNLCVVGDDDQSIYAWRGAEVGNILRFERDFPGAKVVRLERNYRSTPHILGAASGLIAANTSRLGKTLRTGENDGKAVTVTGVWDAQAEARLISTEVENWKSGGRTYGEIAILVRASWQMRSFEERFIQLGLPYRVVGGPRFFERQEIRDAHAYLRAVRSPSDDLAFERIVNVPKRGIGQTTVQKLQRAARAMNISLEAATRQLTQADEIRGMARTSLKAFICDIDRWRADMAAIKHTDLAGRILDESGYTQMWRDNKGPTSQGRLENLKELIQAMGEFGTLEAYLEHVALVLDIETGPSEDKLLLMTLHAAKGLEFPLVFLPGWEEGVFPSQRSLEENGLTGLEEERRLAYVGLTRAREEAKIYFAASRQVYGSWQSSEPSRFIDELPSQHVEAESETGYYRNRNRKSAGSGCFMDIPGTSGSSSGWKRYQANGGRFKTIEGSPARKAEKNSGTQFKVGERIFHRKFGYGTITGADGNKLDVSFEKAGQKKILDRFAERSEVA